MRALENEYFFKDFVHNFTAAMSSAAGVAEDAVEITDLYAGSVQVDSAVRFTSYVAEQVAGNDVTASSRFLDLLTADPHAVFASSAFFQIYAGEIGSMDVSIRNARLWISPPPPSPAPPPPPTDVVGSLSELISALTNPTIQEIIVWGDIFLDGSELPVVDRLVRLRGACGEGHEAKCILDAGGRSRHLSIGTKDGSVKGILLLEKMELVNGQIAVQTNGGGAIFVGNGSQLVMEDCLLRANVALTSYGGAVFVFYHGKASLANVRLEDNRAYKRGGALYLQGDTDVQYGCSFLNNTVLVEGNDIYMEVATLRIHSSARPYELGVGVIDPPVILEYNEPPPPPPPPPNFLRGIPISTLDELKAAITNVDYDILLIKENITLDGESLPPVRHHLTIIGECEPVLCTLDAGGQSGIMRTGVANRSWGNLVLEGMHLTGGRSHSNVWEVKSRGAGLHVTANTSATIRGCVFSNNHADGLYGWGGALDVEVDADVEMVETEFRGNRAEKHGGAVSVEGFLSILGGCSFHGNEGWDGEDDIYVYGGELMLATNLDPLPVVTSDTSTDEVTGEVTIDPALPPPPHAVAPQPSSIEPPPPCPRIPLLPPPLSPIVEDTREEEFTIALACAIVGALLVFTLPPVGIYVYRWYRKKKAKEAMEPPPSPTEKSPYRLAAKVAPLPIEGPNPKLPLQGELSQSMIEPIFDQSPRIMKDHTPASDMIRPLPALTEDIRDDHAAAREM
ncbi:hypothetical protein CYMTET_12306 [Cymbomonas tetramitiformis]|uniref:Right handed beta helix domain-containing protein n=1 Tax=Cymbomonas tetramitiformis TaxID=36881 RepID=A0AAE0GKV8_9CHLO|nr:hypothetical protein CYMTET_12306 [Cymbomonas tetramitiformis]